MSEQRPESTETNQSGDLSGPGAGLGATGKTADDFEPGQADPGTAYGDPAGAGTAEDEVAPDAQTERSE